MSAPPLRVARPDPPNVGTSLEQILKLARYQFRDYLRSRRYILMMAIVAIIGAILTAVLAYFRPASLIDSSTAFYGSFWGGGAPVVIVFAGVIFGGDAIAGEFQNKTGYFLMGLPIRRTTIYVGKFLAALAASITAMIVFLLILLANGAYYLGANALPWQLGASFLLAIIYLLALLGTTFLFSSMFKTSAYATLVVAILFLFGFTILQEVVIGLAKIEPWMVISYASSILGTVFENPYPAHITHMTSAFGGRPTTVYTPTIAEGVAIMIAYFVITSLLGLLLFEREEFT
jgi:ABC-2 type transport system permease protein